MSRLRVEQSPLRQLLMGVVGLVLILGAFDVIWLHRVSTPPERNDEGVLTTRGQSQVRGDIVWGGLLLVGGAGLFVAALVGLVERRSMVDVRDDGLQLRIAGPRSIVFVPWEDVGEIRSSVDEDPDGGRPVSVLAIQVHQQGDIPREPWGAEWDGNTLKVDAEGWTVPPEEVAVHGQLALDQYRRDHPSPSGSP